MARVKYGCRQIFRKYDGSEKGKTGRRGVKFWEKQCFTQISRDFESHRLINGFREQNSLIWHEETVCSSTAKTFFSSAHQQFLSLTLYSSVISGCWAILHIYIRTSRLWRKAFSQRNAIHDHVHLGALSKPLEHFQRASESTRAHFVV